MKPKAGPPRTSSFPPEDFVIRRVGNAVMVIGRKYEKRLLTSGILTDDFRASVNGGTAISGGRGTTDALLVEGIGRVVLRRFRRGGLIGNLFGDRYLAPGRPGKELFALAHATACGVPVPEVLGAADIRVGFLNYRGRIATRMIPEAKTLPALLDEQGREQKRIETILSGIGGAIRQMHDAGIYHADLNMNNILVDKTGSIFLIDFDKARVTPTISSTGRVDNLRRLLRSARKLAGKNLTAYEGAFKRILDGYAGDDAKLKRVLRTATLESRSLELRTGLGRLIRRHFA